MRVPSTSLGSRKTAPRRGDEQEDRHRIEHQHDGKREQPHGVFESGAGSGNELGEIPDVPSHNVVAAGLLGWFAAVLATGSIRGVAAG